MDVFNLQASIGIDVNEFIQRVNSAMQAGKEMQKNVDGISDHTKALEARVAELAQKYNTSQKQVQELTQKYLDQVKATGEASEEAAQLAKELTKAEKNADSLEKKLNQMTDKLREEAKATDEVTDSTDEMAESADDATSAVDKFKSAFNFAAAIAAVKKVVDAFKEIINVYAEFEQLEGGVETLFKSGSDKLQAYAKEAYKTAGMSVNEYLQTAMSFSSTLIKALSKQTVQSEEEIERSYSQQLDAQQTTLEETYKNYKRTFEDEYEAYSGYLDEEIAALKKTNDDKLNLLKAAQQEEIDEFENLTDEKLALINKQYMENLKLIDEEKYNQLKAIDEQIEALKNESKAAEEAAEKQAQAQKIAELEKAVQNSHSAKKLQRTQRELADYLAEIAEKEREKERQSQIESLKEQRKAVEDNADKQKDILKEQYNEEVQTVKDARKDELKAIKSAQAEELATLKAQNDSELALMQQYRNDELKELKRSQEDQLEALKSYNTQKLDSLKDYYEQQKELAVANAEIAVYDAEVYQNAADMVDMAVIDMSDNANKFGTDLQSLQAAYRGFSMGNYRLLDNLHLGYSEGANEMQRLLDDAEKISGIHYDISNFSDVISAIHVIQEDMGITGTTARESAETLEGSMKTASAAWENLKLEIGKEDGDIQGAFEAWWDSANTAFFDNILPRVNTIGESVANALTGSDFGTVWSGTLQDIAYGDFFDDASTGYIDLWEKSKTFWNNLREEAGEAGALFGVFGDTWDTLVSKVETAWENIKTLFSNAKDNIITVWSDVTTWFSGVWDGIVEVFIVVADWFKEQFETAWSNIKTAFSDVKRWFTNRWQDIKDIFSKVGSWFKEQFETAWTNIKTAFSNVKTWFNDRWNDIKDVFKGVGSWFSERFQAAYDNVTRIWNGITGFFSGIWEGVSNAAKDGANWVVGHLNGLLDRVEDMINSIVDAINSIGFDGIDIPDKIKEKLGLDDFSINIPRVYIGDIPYLASGTVVPPNYGNFLAVLGDNKREPEIVSPVSTMQKALSDVINRQGGEGVVIEKIEIVINQATGDINRIGDMVVRKIDEALQRRKQLTSYGTGGVR